MSLSAGWRAGANIHVQLCLLLGWCQEDLPSSGAFCVGMVAGLRETMTTAALGQEQREQDTAAEWAQPPSRWRDQPDKQKQSCGQHIAEKRGAAWGPLRQPSQRGSVNRMVCSERGLGLALPSYLLGCGFSGELSGFALDSRVPGRL